MSVEATVIRLAASTILSNVRNRLAGNRADQLVDIIQRSVCSFQTGFPGTQYTVASKHASLKSLLDDNASLEDIRHAALELDNVTFEAIQHACEITVSGIEEYFSAIRRTRDTIPRVCVKTLLGDNVFDIHRGGLDEWTKTKYQENTGFDMVRSSGKQWHEQDIPSAVRKGYKNPRLDNTRAWTYEEKTRFRGPWWWFRQRPFEDDEWAKCWKDFGKRTDTSFQAFYKSTLIVPITLGRGALPDEFREKLADGSSDQVRLTLGFLCLDHPNSGFFDSVADGKNAWIYSDMLSLPILMRSAYLTTSRTYREALTRLEAGGPDFLNGLERPHATPHLITQITQPA